MKKHKGDPPAGVGCIYYRRGDGVDQCYNDSCSEFDPVGGRQPVQASVARHGACGISGILFKARQRPTWLERNGPLIAVLVIVAALVWKSVDVDALIELVGL